MTRVSIVAFLGCFTTAAFGACPDDFVRQMSADDLTKLQKQDMGISCRGTKFTVAGIVSNMKRESDGRIVLSMDVPSASQNQFKTTDPWDIVLASPTACGDAARINKGAKLVVTAEFKKYQGYMNIFADAEKGAVGSK